MIYKAKIKLKYVKNEEFTFKNEFHILRVHELKAVTY